MSGCIAGIAVKERQWLGYWGCGDAVAIRALLRAATGECWQQREEITVTIAASGLTNDEKDAWARGVGEGFILGRDRFGRVPLFWLQREEILWFSTQLQALLPFIEKNIDLAALYAYSCFSYVPAPLTPVVGIYAVEAGTELTWSLKTEDTISAPTVESLEDDWREHPEAITTEAEAIPQLQKLLTQATERQIGDIKNETVGVFLSGGLDSSIVAALLVRAGIKVRAYSLDLGDYSPSELPYAERVAEWLNVPLVKVAATPNEIYPAIVPTLRALDLPFGDGVTVPLYLLNRAAREEVGIIFNGEGGDQLFAGWTNKPLIAASLYQSQHPEGEVSFERQYLKTFHRLWGYEERVFQVEAYRQIRALDAGGWLYPALEETAATGLLHRLRRATLMLKGAQNIQPRASNLALACSLAVRTLFCDRELAAWTFRLSGELCLQGACEKYILKRAVEDWLPSEIVWRQKRGMGVPLTPWCLEHWWRDLGRWLNPATLAAQGHLQPDLPLRVATGEFSGLIRGRRIGETLWLLVAWQLWREQVLGEKSPSSVLHPFWLPPTFWRLKKQWS